MVYARRYGLAAAVLVVAPAHAATLKTLYKFPNPSVGDEPKSALVADARGNLYGTTIAGGSKGYGIVFEYSPKTNQFKTLHGFVGGADGASPYEPLVFDQSGLLWGLTAGDRLGNGELIYTVDPASGNKTTISTFQAPCAPEGPLVIDQAGFAYAIAGCDELVKIQETTGAQTDVHDFVDATGAAPFGGLTSDGAGNLYGTAFTGGSGNGGVVFKFAISTGTYSVLYPFSQNGLSAPWSRPIFGADGLLYGATAWGPPYKNVIPYGSGGLYRLDPNTGNETDLYFFDNSSAADPQSVLTLDSSGVLYGLTDSLGKKRHTKPVPAYVFALNPTTGSVAFDYQFSKGTVIGNEKADEIGVADTPGLLPSGHGTFYGVIPSSRSAPYGSIFELTP